MAYYRWRAYDTNTTQHSGVTEENRWEMVVFKLAQKGLTTAEVQVIEAPTYHAEKLIQDQLEQLLKVKNKLQPSEPTYVNKHWWTNPLKLFKSLINIIKNI